MPKKRKKINSKEDSRAYAFITAFFSIIGFIISILAWRKDKYVMFYAKQSLVLFILSIIVSLVEPALELISVVGALINVILNVVIFIMWVLTWAYALSGKKKDVFLIGDFAKKIDL